MTCAPERAIQSCETGQCMPYFRSFRLIITIESIDPTCVVWSWHLKDSPRKEKVLKTRVFVELGRRPYHFGNRFSVFILSPRAFWALLVAFPTLSLAGRIVTSLRNFG